MSPSQPELERHFKQISEHDKERGFSELGWCPYCLGWLGEGRELTVGSETIQVCGSCLMFLGPRLEK